VFHCAATLRLEAKLKDAIDMNTSGTRRMLDFCKTMKKLDVLLHLSTAFCNCDQVRREESSIFLMFRDINGVFQFFRT
jgi:Male sterility protein